MIPDVLFVSKKIPNNAVTPQTQIVFSASRRPAESVRSVCGITALFGVFLETNKHQNLTRLTRCYDRITENCNRQATDQANPEKARESQTEPVRERCEQTGLTSKRGDKDA